MRAICLPLLLSLCALPLCAGTAFAQESARLPAAMGTHYPGNPETLLRTVRKFTDAATPGDTAHRLDLVLVPHDPYGLCGNVIGKTLGSIQPGQYDQVIIIAPAYFQDAEGCVMPDTQAYITPLGAVPIDETAARRLSYSALFASGPVRYNRAGHATSPQAREYAIEVLLPFLQDRIGLFRLVPIVVGNLRGLNDKYDPNRIGAVANSIREIMSDRCLIVCTAHLTQFVALDGVPPQPDVLDRIESLDGEAIQLLLQRKPDELQDYLFRTNNDFNSPDVLHLMMRLLPKNTAGEVRDYVVSGRLTGMTDRSISYAGLAYYNLDAPPLPAMPERRLMPSDPSVLARPAPEPAAPEVSAPAPAPAPVPTPESPPAATP